MLFVYSTGKDGWRDRMFSRHIHSEALGDQMIRAWPCLVIALVACGGNEAAVTSEGPVYCIEQGDCEAGFACDSWTGLCVCASSGVCPEQELCNPYTGRCEAQEGRCGSDTSCAPSEYCSSVGRCVARKSLCQRCEQSNECGGAEDLCLPGGACGIDCSHDADACPPGSVCWPFGNASQCVPALGDCSVPPRCRADSDCPPGNTCLDGTCQASCQSDSNCPAQWRCLDQLCHPPANCDDDRSCSQGTICQAGRCLPGCNDNSNCPLGETCQEGRCQQGCDAHADCPLDRACQAGQCVDEICIGNDCALACQVDLFCGPGRHCDQRQGRCRDGLPGGLCVACNQMVTGQCGTGLCLGTPTRRACTGNRDCTGGGEYCDRAYGCFRDRECPGGQTCLDANIAQNQAGRCSGGTCSNFRCVTPCDANLNSCPVGFACEEVRRAGGGSVIGTYCQPEDGEFCP